MNEYDVIIVGGGITGAGTARDCALRGLRVLLIERFDIATGATGRNHGLLHSGARYAVTDQESATECIKENMILKKIARHCVDDTSGLFITLPEDDLAYQDTFVKACLAAGINAEVIDPEEAKRMEPSVNPSLIGAVKVPDGSVDPFRLCASNVFDAKIHGAKVLVYSEVIEFIKEQDTIKGVKVLDHHTGIVIQTHNASADVTAARIIVSRNQRTDSGVSPQDTCLSQTRSQFGTLGQKQINLVWSHLQMIAFLVRNPCGSRSDDADRVTRDKNVSVRWLAATVDNHTVDPVRENRQRGHC